MYMVRFPPIRKYLEGSPWIASGSRMAFSLVSHYVHVNTFSQTRPQRKPVLENVSTAQLHIASIGVEHQPLCFLSIHCWQCWCRCGIRAEPLCMTHASESGIAESFSFCPLVRESGGYWSMDFPHLLPLVGSSWRPMLGEVGGMELRIH
jgi:hypothetical protein